MIKVQTMTISSKKGMWSANVYSYIQQWVDKNAPLYHFKMAPDRHSITFYDEEGFEQFKKTFEKPWFRIY